MVKLCPKVNFAHSLAINECCVKFNAQKRVRKRELHNADLTFVSRLPLVQTTAPSQNKYCTTGTGTNRKFAFSFLA